MAARKAQALTRRPGVDDLGVLVLAAGKSTRIMPLSQGRPKPLLEVAGEAILKRNLRWLARQGVRSAWVNLHYRPDEIQAAIGSGGGTGLQVAYSHEPEILGTAGAYKNLEHSWQGTTLLVYGDSLLRFDLAAFLAAHQAMGGTATIGLFDPAVNPHTGIAGGRVKLAPEGRVLGFVEGAPAHADGTLALVNAGVYLLEPQVLEVIPPGSFHDFGHDVFPRLLDAGAALRGHVIDGYCLGLDTPASFARAQELIQEGKVSLA